MEFSYSTTSNLFSRLEEIQKLLFQVGTILEQTNNDFIACSNVINFNFIKVQSTVLDPVE